MARSNEKVAELFQEYADLISITGGNTCKARAYEKPARAIGGHHADVDALDVQGLQRIPGVGRRAGSGRLELERLPAPGRDSHVPTVALRSSSRLSNTGASSRGRLLRAKTRRPENPTAVPPSRCWAHLMGCR
ncbi:hypothetical protein GCM10010377_76570 [Streptomyces viridiviolaceus]|nr:hypothetical protein GCM10010377_76570 [Streptomyces viridiviolaceus]